MEAIATDLCCICREPYAGPVPGPAAVEKFRRRVSIQFTGVPCSRCLNRLHNSHRLAAVDSRTESTNAKQAAQRAILADDYEAFAEADRTIELQLSSLDSKIRDLLELVKGYSQRHTEVSEIRAAVNRALAASPSASYFERRRQADRVIADPSLRLEIFLRDGHQCRQCRSSRRLTVDHVVSVRRGGSDDRSNLQTLCRSCNCSKGWKDVDFEAGYREFSDVVKRSTL